MSVVQQEIIMLPRVVATQHENQMFTYNGVHGVHRPSNVIVFQFSDEFDLEAFWADADGNFVCEL